MRKILACLQWHRPTGDWFADIADAAGFHFPTGQDREPAAGCPRVSDDCMTLPMRYRRTGWLLLRYASVNSLSRGLGTLALITHFRRHSLTRIYATPSIRTIVSGPLRASKALARCSTASAP